MSNLQLLLVALLFKVAWVLSGGHVLKVVQVLTERK